MVFRGASDLPKWTNIKKAMGRMDAEGRQARHDVQRIEPTNVQVHGEDPVATDMIVMGLADRQECIEDATLAVEFAASAFEQKQHFLDRD